MRRQDALSLLSSLLYCDTPNNNHVTIWCDRVKLWFLCCQTPCSAALAGGFSHLLARFKKIKELKRSMWEKTQQKRFPGFLMWMSTAVTDTLVFLLYLWKKRITENTLKAVTCIRLLTSFCRNHTNSCVSPWNPHLSGVSLSMTALSAEFCPTGSPQGISAGVLTLITNAISLQNYFRLFHFTCEETWHIWLSSICLSHIHVGTWRRTDPGTYFQGGKNKPEKNIRAGLEIRLKVRESPAWEGPEGWEGW